MAVSIFDSGLLGLVGIIPVDVRLGEFHGKSAQVSNFAVESGANRQDHIVLNPDTIEIPVYISNQDFDGISHGIRAATIAQLARTLMNRRTLFTVVTRHHLYTDMAFIGFPHENTAPFTGALTGRFIFQKFNQPVIEVVDVPAEQLAEGDTQSTASGTVEGGQQQPASPSPQRSSLLNQIFGG